MSLREPLFARTGSASDFKTTTVNYKSFERGSRVMSTLTIKKTANTGTGLLLKAPVVVPQSIDYLSGEITPNPVAPALIVKEMEGREKTKELYPKVD